MLVSEERLKPEYPEQSKEPQTNSNSTSQINLENTSNTKTRFVFIDGNNFPCWYVRDPASYRDLKLFKGKGVHCKRKQFFI